MFGDNLDTDIEFGKNNGIATALMLTGVTSLSDPSDVKKIEQSKPNYVLSDLSQIFDI